MTRREVFQIAATSVVAPPDTPKNRVALAANEFHEYYVKWAKAMNTMEPATQDTTPYYAEALAFETLPELWRKVEKLRRAWLKKVNP